MHRERRVTAMAISPTCSAARSTCGSGWRCLRRQGAQRLELAISGNFGTNAIGSLLMDSRDSSGNTLYAGTGEPNASADSEAGVGIYKTTDGGQT
jgi:hypothetical protein